MKKRTGFTLVELLVVISLIGILSAVAIAVINPAKMMGKSRDARRKSDLKAIQGALELFYSQNRRYPNLAEVNFGGAMTLKRTCTPAGTEVYMNNVPQDPLNPQNDANHWRYCYRSYDPSINICDSTPDSNPAYLLCSCVEDSSNDIQDTVSFTSLTETHTLFAWCSPYCTNLYGGGVTPAGYYGMTNPF
jgi:prepilin-type N-terminal cleavage/methylation domain-containing protein